MSDFYNGTPWGDQGNGTFNNPVLPADFRDPDVLRVGEDYYLISSTFWMSPGISILHSRDLVNWRYLKGAIPDISQISRTYTWANMNYPGGVWAPCLTYQAATGTYYIHWGDNLLGFFMVSATSMEGPWTAPRPVLVNGQALGPQVDDCGVMWEADGTGWFAYNCYGSDHSYKNYLHQLAADGVTLLDTGVKIHENHDHYGKNHTGAEAYKLFHKDGFYYLWHNEVPPDGRRRLCLMRSPHIYGLTADGQPGTFDKPGRYEHGDYFMEGYRQPSQGLIVDSPDGKNWFLVTHLDKAETDGAPLCVVPMEWKDGWIVPATMDQEAMWKKLPLPVKGQTSSRPATSDEFDAPVLGAQWLWNHQPRADKWSLTQRPGYLRLHAWKTNRWWAATDQINLAGNTLYQRYFRNHRSVVTVKLDPSGMADGQNGGLVLMNYGRYVGLGVHQRDGGRFLRYHESTAVGLNPEHHLAVDGVELPPTSAVYLRSESDFAGNQQFSYSLDGTQFWRYGPSKPLVVQGHRGYMVGVFTYNNQQEAGWLDVDSFQYKMHSKE